MALSSNQRDEKATSPVTITGTIIRSSSRLGEASHWRPKSEPLQRLIDHIMLMMDLVNLEHQNRHFTQVGDRYTVKPGHEDKLTKVALVEFSLYTPTDPLTFEELEKLVSAITEKAKNCRENLSFLFSSFAVLTSENQLLNYAIHVQCGALFKLQTIHKQFSMPDDPEYDTATARLRYYQKNKDKKESPPKRFFSKTSQHPIEPKLPIIEIHTLSGKLVLDMVDICADNDFYPVHSHYKEMAPYRVSHTLTSNSKMFKLDRIAGNHIIHADYAMPNVWSSRNNYKSPLTPTKTTPPSADELKRFIPERYSETEVTVDAKGIIVTDPPFGSGHYTITFYPEIELENSAAILTHELLQQLQQFYKEVHKSEKCLSLKQLGTSEDEWRNICITLAKFKEMLAHPITVQKYYSLKDSIITGQKLLEVLTGLLIQLANRYKEGQISKDVEGSFAKEFNFFAGMCANLTDRFCTWIAYTPTSASSQEAKGQYEGAELEELRSLAKQLQELAEKIKNERFGTLTPSINIGILAAMLNRISTAENAVPRQLVVNVLEHMKLTYAERGHFSSAKDISIELAFYATCDRFKDYAHKFSMPGAAVSQRL